MPRIWSGLPSTLTATNNKILVGTAERASNHVISLFLPKKPPHYLSRLDLNQLDFIISHIDEHISRVLADANAGHFGFQQDAVLFFPSHEVVYKYLPFGRDSDKPLPVGRDGTIRYSIVGRPGV